MTEVPATAKKPQDRKPKAEDAPTDVFEFTHDDVTFTSKPFLDVLTPGFLRRNRQRETMDFYFTMLEALYADQPAAVAAFDAMSWPEFNALSEQLETQMREKVGANLGE